MNKQLEDYTVKELLLACTLPACKPSCIFFKNCNGFSGGYELGAGIQHIKQFIASNMS